ncbi:hypothetical protein ACFL3G_11700 [Planctomycetota bacterium]
MLDNAIEKNERFLRFCGQIAHFSGLILLFFVFSTLAYSLLPLFSDSPEHHVKNLYLVIPRIIKLAFTALLLRGISQFVKCLFEINFKPNWILRFADKIIYLYAIFLLVSLILAALYKTSTIEISAHHYFVTLILPAMFRIVKILLWIGVGLVSKRIVPIIQESKTLV